MLIILEGMDKVGKTTLISHLNKATDFKHIILDRGSISSYVYDAIYKRNIRKGYDFFTDAVKKMPHIVFLLVADKKVIANRLKQAGETLPALQQKMEIDDIQIMFYDEAKASGLNIEIVASDVFDIETTTVYMVKIIERKEAALEGLE